MSFFDQDSYDSIGTTSTGLLKRVKDRDQQAWRKLVRLYGRLVLFWCRQAGLQRADRADVFQDVFRAVARHIDGFRREQPGDSFRGWLRSVTRSKIVDHFRRRQREPAATGGSETYQRLLSMPEELLEQEIGSEQQNEEGILVKQALQMIRGDFEERTWKAFWRTVADGVATSVVAEELSMSQAAVRKAKSRVLRRLREEFAGLIDEWPDAE